MAVAAPPAGERGFFLSSRLAVGTDHLVVGSPFGGFAWLPLREGKATAISEKALANILDLDARGDRVVIVGADRGDVLGLARDGAIAWVGTLSKGLADMRPLMIGRSKPGGKDMARCAFLGNGGIRIMEDGSIVIAPGSEPDVHRYSAAGKLLQTWETASLGILDDCDVDETERMEIGRDFPQRIQWLASRITIDDVLPLKSGPALILRRVEKGVTKWDLVTLPYQGKSERLALPISLPSPQGYLRGDVRDGRIVFLLFEAPLPDQSRPAPAQLFVFALDESH